VTINVVTTVLAPARTYALTTLAVVRDELEFKSSDTTKDAWLTRAIDQTSRAMMSETNRVFAPELVQDVIDIRRTRSQVPTGVDVLQLARWPVMAIASVVQSLPETATTRTLVEGTDFRTDAADGQLLRLDATGGRVIAWEPLPVTVAYVAGYGEMESEAHTVPASVAYTVTVAEAASFSCDMQVAYASGALLTRVTGTPTQGQYSVAAGVYTFNVGDASQALTFDYATQSVPDDLAEACLRIVTGRFRAKGRDPALVQRDTPGVGSERFWFGNAPGQTGPFPPDIQAMLDNYDVPTVA
jgi:hypothetical protein